MIIAITSCPAYADAQNPFMSLFRHFWPECKYPVHTWGWHDDRPWAPMVASHARSVSDNPREPILLMQEDFFLTARVQAHLIQEAEDLYWQTGAGCVRLYPCPGSEDMAYQFADFGIIPKATDYRISCQAAIWRPAFLESLASRCGETASDFEIQGTALALQMDEPVWSWKRDRQPWPMEYLCSAINRGKWNPAAIEICRKVGFELDTSHREVALA